MPLKIECNICHEKFGCKKIVEHYDECIKNIFSEKSGYLIKCAFQISRKESENIYLCVGLACTQNDIKSFLDDITCECCNYDKKIYIVGQSGEIFEYNCSQKLKLYKKNKSYCNFFEYTNDDVDNAINVSISIEHKFNINAEITNKIEILKSFITPKCVCKKCHKYK